MPSSEQDVHLLRTTIRRLEVQLADPPAKVAKSLKDLRKEAGKVRDIDVHLALLKPPLSRPRSPDRDAVSTAQEKLRAILKSRHDRRLDSLQHMVTAVRPRLVAKLPALAERAALHLSGARDAQHQTRQAREQFLQLTRRVPTDPGQLHRLRIKTKRLRYAMEPLEAFPDAAELAEKFKHVQDAVGTWHDWATLTLLAQRKLPSSDAEPLCAVLQARTGREYRKARRAAQNVRSWMSGKPAASLVIVARNSQRVIHKVG
jgi:CHAD domain-containing protein